MVKYRELSHERFLKCINILSANLEKFLDENDFKVDYIMPIVRSGSVPAVYISNKLNIVKFAPIQIKHITYNDGRESIETIFNPLNSLDINKEKPVFLIVDALQSSGKSAEIAIKEIKNVYSDAVVLYVCITKKYLSNDFKGTIEYFDYAFQYNEDQFDEEKCLSLGIDYYAPVFPWEKEDDQINYPDDLEDNIFF